LPRAAEDAGAALRALEAGATSRAATSPAELAGFGGAGGAGGGAAFVTAAFTLAAGSGKASVLVRPQPAAAKPARTSSTSSAETRTREDIADAVKAGWGRGPNRQRDSGS